MALEVSCLFSLSLTKGTTGQTSRKIQPQEVQQVDTTIAIREMYRRSLVGVI
jgi:hypothetical protein